MKFSTAYSVQRTALAVISAVLLILSFPGFNIWPLAWIAFIPLFFALDGQKPLKAFLISYLTGFIFFLGTVYWLIHVTLPGMIIVAAYLALYFGVFGIIISLISALNVSDLTPTVIYAPAAWVTLEWLRAHLLTGFGWQLLGYSQSSDLPVIQIADVTGVYGVSFIVMMLNAAVFASVKNFKNKKDAYFPVIISGVLILAVITYGMFRLNSVFTGDKINVAIVQGNIPQDEKWDRNFTEMILSRYESLTRAASKGNPDLVIWPETSVPGFVEDEKNLYDAVKGLAVEINTPLLVGAPRYEMIKGNEHYYNSAFLFMKDGSLQGRYDKIHLVPFGEYLPLKNALAFVHKFAHRPIGDFTAGKNFTIFRFFIHRAVKGKDFSMNLSKKVEFSTLVCFEDIFPELAVEFVRNGADFLVNITNDGWFGRSAAAYQHAQNSVFRAVENRVNVIRAANIGLSCFIDQKGRVTARVENGGRDLFVDGFTLKEIVLTKTRTIYNIYPDVLVYLCAIIASFSVAHSLRKARGKT